MHTYTHIHMSMTTVAVSLWQAIGNRSFAASLSAPTMHSYFLINCLSHNHAHTRTHYKQRCRYLYEGIAHTCIYGYCRLGNNHSRQANRSKTTWKSCNWLVNITIATTKSVYKKKKYLQKISVKCL